MKIPKHIDEALKRRTRAAKMFANNDYIISKWIDDNGLDEVIDASCFHGGVESVINPEETERAIRDAIANAVR